jgi:hypothetical protein
VPETHFERLHLATISQASPPLPRACMTSSHRVLLSHPCVADLSMTGVQCFPLRPDAASFDGSSLVLVRNSANCLHASLA